MYLQRNPVEHQFHDFFIKFCEKQLHTVFRYTTIPWHSVELWKFLLKENSVKWIKKVIDLTNFSYVWWVNSKSVQIHRKYHCCAKTRLNSHTEFFSSNQLKVLLVKLSISRIFCKKSNGGSEMLKFPQRGKTGNYLWRKKYFVKSTL